MEWQAKWIWDKGEMQPSNHWLCFRKSFLMADLPDEALFHITADSKYIAYINGIYLGMGPVRGWPTEPFYDTYDIKDILVSGENVLAILVTHYGVSTFQYVEGRGGLLAQLDLVRKSEIEMIGTNNSWSLQVHSGYGRSAERICCQLAWAEVYDAGEMDESWMHNDFDDHSWEKASEIGNVGMLPWLEPQKRDIPPMREEAKYPLRMEWARRVVPRGQPISLNLRSNLFPGQTDANPKSVLAYVASVIHSPIDMDCTIQFPWNNWLSTYGDFRINNESYEVPENRVVAVKLAAGDNFFIMDISGSSHLSSLFFHVDSERPVAFMTPGYASSGFVTLGPFAWKSILQTGNPQSDELDCNNEQYELIGKAGSWDDLLKFTEHLQPIVIKDSCLDNVYMPDLYKDIIEEAKASQLMQAMIIPNRSYFTIQPDDSGDWEVMLDFGQEVSGFIEFELDAPAGTIVDFCGAERIRSNRTSEPMDGMNNTLRYVAKEGQQTYRSFVRRGFRFLTVTFRKASRPVKVFAVYVQLNTFPAAYIGQFACSDWKLNRIWEISRHTTLLCMEDTFVDCPSYEQTFWVGDARNVALINYYTFGSYDLVRRSLRLVAKSLERSPVVESQVPSGWQNVLSAWSLFWVVACKEYYDFTADFDFIKDIYPDLTSNMEGFISRLDERSLLVINAWNILEWAPMDTPEAGVVTHLNAGLVSALHAMNSLARSLGDEKEALKWFGFADGIKKAINEFLWDDAAQAFVDCLHENGEKSKVISMQTNVMVYLSSCADGLRKSQLEQYLRDAPESFVQIRNPFMLFFYFEALTRIGWGDQILQMISQQWGQMIDQGATTCWETITRPDMYHPTRSYCHAWSAAPAYYLGSHVLGVRPLSPGFTKIIIDPMSSELLWAKGSVPLPQGRIDVEWEKTDAGVKLSYYAPSEIEIVLGNTVIISN